MGVTRHYPIMAGSKDFGARTLFLTNDSKVNVQDYSIPKRSRLSFLVPYQRENDIESDFGMIMGMSLTSSYLPITSPVVNVGPYFLPFPLELNELPSSPW